MSDITKCSSEILKAKTIRNKAVERLKIDREQTTQAAIEVLYSQVQANIEDKSDEDSTVLPTSDDAAGNLEDK